MLLLVILVVVIEDLVSIVMQGNGIKLLKGISYLTTWRGKVAVKGYSLHFARVYAKTFVDLGPTKIDAVALLDIPEIDRVNTTTLVGDDWRFAMP